MLVDVAMAAILLALGNAAFWHFDPVQPLWRRLLKIILALVFTAIISCYFGRTGVLIAFAAASLPLIFVHAIWLPRNGVNGWTGEPRDKYNALRRGQTKKR